MRCNGEAGWKLGILSHINASWSVFGALSSLQCTGLVADCINLAFGDTTSDD
jgi:hypothetical protein